MKKVLAFDFGASGGRAFLGCFDGDTISLDEVYRFDNEPVRVRDSLYWDTLRLYREIKEGIVRASQRSEFASIGIDTWGVDFALLSANGSLLENSYHYRDNRTDGMLDEVGKRIDAGLLYQMTGNQIMQINTLFQLYAARKADPRLFAVADTMLLTPDLFNYFLTGRKHSECTIASTTQLMDPFTRSWNLELLRMLDLPAELLPPVVQPGTSIGVLHPQLCNELRTTPKNIIAVASHDTASAIVAVPANQQDFIFISCGTWSLFGTELDRPLITRQSEQYNLTNEAGFESRTEFLNNICGLWLIQETRRQFIRSGKALSYPDLEAMAGECEKFKYFIDPDSHVFAQQGDIPERIIRFCEATGQGTPQTDGEIVRCIYDSIAFKYRLTLEQIKECTSKDYHTIHMLGGGSKDELLCRLTSDATGSTIIAGPAEATAMGNVAVQLIALGCIPDLKTARQIIAGSVKTKCFKPRPDPKLEPRYEYYKKNIVKREI